MNPLHLRTLLAIIDEGSFELAAYKLGISPSAVSQRIKALEKAAGRIILRRTTPVSATQAGEVLVQSARRMALLEAETNAELRGHISKIPLSVVVNADSLSTWFRSVLAQLASWGQVNLHLRIEDEAHSLSLLRKGDVLGAVTRESQPVAGCEVMPLGVMRYYSVANPWLLDRYTHDGVVDWMHMPTLRFGSRDSLQDEDFRKRVGKTLQPEQISQIPSAEAFMEAARVGLGWALLPEQQALELIESGQVVRLDDQVMTVPLYWQRWRLESPSLERLSDAVMTAAQQLHHLND
ncbi:LysR family transcriptional regulator ArgP [Corynebacterium sp. sy017]|uniref:LysR family transcriptional regulator ArgP n=1 Tax=unclassified Corynebacterium TaxID=2624378 RepID=UPI001185E416|nr:MULTISPECIES: LysR family transcriptional regulator ArgP [unclassified Corynebacterium]MBP3089048.1 LysR family transcriptional regulator ArgP [Corynebacterium sp. sy017]QDZ42411.1 LysR family transcriptional regulator ArgP [Corynebacterium sp. sy039]TSD91366.1 LysR family transcriptional regulator ArgP [Corynebacterium sp. SY003]